MEPEISVTSVTAHQRAEETSHSLTTQCFLDNPSKTLVTGKF